MRGRFFLTWTSHKPVLMALGSVFLFLPGCDSAPRQSRPAKAPETKQIAIDAVLVAQSKRRMQADRGSDQGKERTLPGHNAATHEVRGKAAGPAPPASARVPSPARAIVQVPVYFVTDRQRLNYARSIAFTGYRGGALSYGRVTVSIPPTHVAGEIESPLRIWRIRFPERPSKHVVMYQPVLATRDAWLAQLRAKVSSSRRRQAFLFVHGYNVSFADAAKRTAQIAYDVRFEGPAMLFSWASRAAPAEYTFDEASVQVSGHRLAGLIEDVVRTAGAQDMYLIAHSMGNRALTEGLLLASQRRPDIRRIVREVVLAAPDIDAEYFREAIAPQLPRAAQRVTLYASSRDAALLASHGFHAWPRAGESGENLIVAPPIVTIDATAANADLLGHSYIGSSPSVLADLRDLFRNIPAASRPNLSPRRRGNDDYWLLTRPRN